MSTETLTTIEKHWPIVVYMPTVFVVLVVLVIITRIWDHRSDGSRLR